jgi:hypothetical protein
MSQENENIEPDESDNDDAKSLEEEVPMEWNKSKYKSLHPEDGSIVKKTIHYAKQFRPDSNSVDIGDAGKLSWKIRPKGSELGKAIIGKDNNLAKETKLKLEYRGNVDDVEFYAVVQGKPYKIARDGLQADDSFKAEIGFTKKI